MRFTAKGDYLTGRDKVTNIAVKGSIGKGKTFGVADNLLRSAVECGEFGLILCAKTDTAERAIEIIQSCQRASKIAHITPRSGHYFNPIEFAMKQGGDFFPLDEALNELWTMLEIINRGEVSQQGDNCFVPAQRQMIHEAMKVLYCATGSIDLRLLNEACQLMPPNYQALDNPNRYPILRLIDQARKKFPAGRNEHLDRAADYFTHQLPGLSDKTRSSIQISATVRMSALLEPIYSMLFSRPSNITPADIIDQQMWCVLDIPYSLYRSASRAIGVCWKQALQKELMRRRYKQDRPLCAIFQDECACWLSDMDIEAAERGRSSGFYHVNTFQSYSTLVNGYGGGAPGEAKAKALTSNFGVHIMTGQTDADTRMADEKMLGKIPMWVQSINENWKHGDQMGAGGGESYALQYLPSLPEESFLDLESGQRGYIESFVFIGGRKFNWNGKRWLRVRWDPKYGEWTWWQAVREKYPTARGWWLHVSPKMLWEAFKQPGRWAFDHEFRRWLHFWMEARGRFTRGTGYNPDWKTTFVKGTEK